LQASLGPERPLAREAIRFALDHPQISSVLIGFGETSEIDSALAAIA
jgi:predicted aldo/keto reductase-like oxidoreductase